MPFADRIILLLDNSEEVEMNAIHEPFFFECIIENENLPSYQFKIFESNSERVIFDPYSFEVRKLSELDFHLFSEGNHHHIYEKMGAHIIELNGVWGVFFSLWAPNALNVSIIGDFNRWDGRIHQMKKVHDSIWELFIPDLKEGDCYKFRIKLLVYKVNSTYCNVTKN
jgi:1,4-alpha-glucan branching enzyme